ncbi:MAG: GNAT family N-acetyltransferase [Pirellulales bacterium]
MPSHFLHLQPGTFDDYLTSMRSNYRIDLKGDMKLFDRRRVRIEELDETQKRSDPITPELYEFYLQLLERVEFHLLTLPREYFNEFTRRYADRLQVLRATVDGRPAGFFLSIPVGDMYQLLIVAVDEDLSRQFGIYRNMYFHEMESALARGFHTIGLGTTADEFKLRLGSKPRNGPSM